VKKIQDARDGEENMIQQEWCRLNSPSKLHSETTKSIPASLYWAAQCWDVDGIFEGLIIPTEIAKASLHFSYTQDHDTAFASILLQRQSDVDSEAHDPREPSLFKNLSLVKAPAGFKDRYQSADRAFGLHRGMLSAMCQMSNNMHVFIDRSPQQLARAMNFYADAIGGKKLPSLSREELCKGFNVLGAIAKAEDELSDGSAKDAESMNDSRSFGSLYDTYDNDYYGATFEYSRPTRADSQISVGGGGLPAYMSQTSPTELNPNLNLPPDPNWGMLESLVRTRSDTGGDDHNDIQYVISNSNSSESNSFKSRNDAPENEHWIGIDEMGSGSANDADNDSEMSAFGFGSIHSMDSRGGSQGNDLSHTHAHAASDDHADTHIDRDLERGMHNPFYKS
jgi:hypothetical protein